MLWDSDSQTLVCTRISWRAYKRKLMGPPHSEFLIQYVFSGALDFAFLTTSWLMLMLLVRNCPSENHCSRKMSLIDHCHRKIYLIGVQICGHRVIGEGLER